MFKKTFAVIALAALAVLAGPVAANAATPYVPNSNIAVTGSTTAGGTSVITFASGSFTGNGGSENVAFQVSGSGTATLSAVHSAVVSLTKAATAGGVVINVKLPAGATGTYTVTATGATSGIVGTASITVKAADGLPFTGASVSPLIIWGTGGVLLLGIALLLVRGIVRRQRANA